MVKATIITKSGTKVTFEGTDAEVGSLVAKFEQPNVPSARRKSRATPQARKSNAKPTLIGLVGELIDGGFFRKPKELGAVRLALEEQGHFYPVTTLSPLMLRLVRRKELRRIKDKKRWLYVG